MSRPARRSRLDLVPLILPALVLVAWEIASATGLLRAVFFPRPSTIARLLVAQVADGTLLAPPRRSRWHG